MKLAKSQDKDLWWTAPASPKSPAAPVVDTAGDRHEAGSGGAHDTATRTPRPCPRRSARPLQEVMTPEVVYGFDDQDVEDIARLLAQDQMCRLRVLHRRRELVSMVALGDLAVYAGTQPVTAEGLAQGSEPGKAERK
jgi:hypothetical protein